MGIETRCDANKLDSEDDYEACGRRAVVIVEICEPCFDAGAPFQRVEPQAFCLAHLPDILKYEPGIGAYFK